jgi:hypothetical protein
MPSYIETKFRTISPPVVKLYSRVCFNPTFRVSTHSESILCCSILPFRIAGIRG